MRSFLLCAMLVVAASGFVYPGPASSNVHHTAELEASGEITKKEIQTEYAGVTNLQAYLNGDTDVLYQHAISELIKTFYIA